MGSDNTECIGEGKREILQLQSARASMRALSDPH